MKNKRLEENIIITINALKKIMVLFLGPFLTAYFIKKSQESVVDLSIYYIFSYFLLAVGSFIVASIIKTKFRIGMFRIGVIFNFFYIMSIIILKEKIINHLEFISILYGISSSAYWFPYNLFVINKIDNSERTRYTVKSKIISSVVGVLSPILLGSLITVTNYELTALIILFISFIQIILSFMLSTEKESNLSKFNLKKTWNKLKHNRQIKIMTLVEFFIGMNVSDGALEVLMTILIFNSFKTNMNLGIITSITTILSIIFVHIYGKISKITGNENIELASFSQSNDTLNGYVNFNLDNILVVSTDENLSQYRIYDYIDVYGKVSEYNNGKIILTDTRLVASDIYDSYSFEIIANDNARLTNLVKEKNYYYYGINSVNIKYDHDNIYELSYLLTDERFKFNDLIKDKEFEVFKNDEDNEIAKKYKFDKFDYIECSNNKKIVANTKNNVDGSICDLELD